MTGTDSMSKKGKLMKANKALIAFFTVVLMIGLFPIGMAAFGGSDGAETADAPAETTEATAPEEAPSHEDATVDEVAPVVSEDVAEPDEGPATPPTDADEDALVEEDEEAEESGEVEQIDPFKRDIEIVLGDPSIMTLAADDNKQTIVIDTNEYDLGGETLCFGDGRNHTLTIGEGITLVGDIWVENTANTKTGLTIQGSGAIRGTGNTSVINVIGSNLVLAGDVRIYNGGGSELFSDTESTSKWKLNYGKVGGGILVQKGLDSLNRWSIAGSLTMNDGVVGASAGSVGANTASAGGGIFVDSGCTFAMNGGTIGYNTATQHEGGGAFFYGNGTISAGTIIGNQCLTNADWGGGGLFVNTGATLEFKGAAMVTENTANGLGGGISGCPHANIGIGKVTNGFAVYGNDASMSTSPRTTDKTNLWHNSNGMGDIWAYQEDGDFDAQDAQDFYSVNGAWVYGQEVTSADGISYVGRIIKHDGSSITSAYDTALLEGQWLTEESGTVGLTAKNPPISGAREILISGNHSNTHGGGVGCNGTVVMGSIPNGEWIWDSTWNITLDKVLLDGIDQSIRPEAGAFQFGLYKDAGCADADLLATATNNSNGTVEFVMTGHQGSNDYFYITSAAPKDFELYIREIPGDDPKISYDEGVYKVNVNLKKELVGKVYFNSTYMTEYRTVATVSFEGGKKDLTITNRYNIEPATWTPVADKAYYGNAVDPSFGFTLQAISDPTTNDSRGKSLAELVRMSGEDESAAALIREAAAQAAGTEALADDGLVDDGDSAFTVAGTAAGFADYQAGIVFPEITYKGVGAYWYVMTEDAIEGSYTDPSAYVLRVEVSLVSSGDDNVVDALKAEQISLYYAESINDKTDELMSLTGDYATIEFVNFDETGEFGLYSFAVNAVTDQPIGSDQRCLVDPKIYKVLEGRQLKDGQFKFSLIQVGSTPVGGDDAAFDGWNNLSGQVISTATNDQYGMVDFDAANNQAAEGEDPCCLVFTAPGTYHYRVVEVEGVGTDPSVDYSKEIITFTAVITGGNGSPLICEDMYYGHLVDGKNVRFDESSDPTWHPTMTNKVRPMELKVRKTSATDRNEGLEGATYGLYLVSDNQNDVFLGEATSDADGWMTFTGEGDEGLDLKAGNLYYFKEIAAPSQHTVSQFRSAYFSIVPDAASEIGYALKYADSRVASAQAVALADNGIAAFAEETTPGVLADDRMLFTYDLDGGVYDEVTAVEFNKLDGRTHAWVPGAKLAVIDKATGVELESWTTGETAHQMSKKLDVETEYILRELEAPADYHKAKDIVFKLDQYGNLEIISGTENDNAGQNDNTLTMFDFMVDAELTLYEYNEREEIEYVDPEPAGKTGGDLVQTGDKPFPIELVIAVVAALGIAGFALVRWRRATSRE